MHAVSVHANNEVGTINDITKLVQVTKGVDPAIYFHTDCSQSAGKVSTNLSEMGVDLATIAGHKIYGPKGAGALYKKKGVVLDKFMHGRIFIHVCLISLQFYMRRRA